MQEANVGPQTEFHDSEDSLSTWALASDADDVKTFFYDRDAEDLKQNIEPTGKF